jgi:hypothetical protein
MSRYCFDKILRYDYIGEMNIMKSKRYEGNDEDDLQAY